MEKEMLELFIYYVLAVVEDGSENYCLNECVKMMEKTLDIIRKMSYSAWNEIMEGFPENHPALKTQRKLMSLTEEQYEQTLLNAQKLMEKYSQEGTLNYDALYLLTSEKDVENFALKIIIKSKETAQIKSEIDMELNSQKTNRDKLINLGDELCTRYYYGQEIEKDYNEAVRGWETIAEESNDAKYSLALCYKKGHGVEQDKEKAYKMLCDIMNDDIRAEYEVARMNFYGDGIEKNYEKAFQMFNKLKGRVPYDLNSLIESYLGEMYFYGLGVEQDKENGFLLLENAWKSNFVKLDYEKIKKVLKDYYDIK